MTLTEEELLPSCHDCNSLKIEANGLCASCAARRRKEAEQEKKRALKKPAFLQRGGPINKMSEKRSEQLTRYNARVKVWKVDKVCKVCEDNGDAEVPCQDAHHMRGKENELLEIEKWWLPVCRTCHIFLHDNPKWALENGYSLPRTTSQEKEPTI